MTTLLIDADILAYKVSAMNEKKFDFGPDGGVATVLTPEKLKADLDEVLQQFLFDLVADDYLICLSDPGANWRKELDPTYKANRTGSVKPVMLDACKRHLYGEYAATVLPRMEADDVMGILATSPKADRQFVIVSEDKDMRTIPGKVYHPHRHEQGIMTISRPDADTFLLYQTLVGDPTDGYPGCPGIGKSSEYVADLLAETDPLAKWDCVIDAYASKGLTEADALLQARLACICRHSNWNPVTRKVRLWNPTHLLHG